MVGVIVGVAVGLGVGDVEVGDYVYGNQSLTVPPVNANFTISNGAKFIQLSGNQIINVGVC